MKILLIIIGILGFIYVGGMMWIICYIAGEADEADEEIWERFNEQNKSNNQEAGREGRTHDVDIEHAEEPAEHS